MNKEELEEKLAELRKKYRDLLKEDRTEDATEVYYESEKLKEEYYGDDEDEQVKEEEPVEKDYDEEESSLDSFEDLKGVGEELAGVLENQFDSVEEMAGADVDDLEPVPGIGVKKAENLIDQLN